MTVSNQPRLREYKIALGRSRFTTTWKNTTITWNDLLARLEVANYTSETSDEYAALPKPDQDKIKDVGGFVAGELREGKRKSGHVNARSMITLDVDHATSMDAWEEIRLLGNHQAAVYSTHKHSPEHPRYRLIFPLARDVTEDEYPAIARMLASRYGIDQFDDTTYEPHRLMYWPSTSRGAEYFFDHVTGDLLDPDAILAEYKDWRDVTTWPTSSRQSEALKATAERQADPLTKPGLIGAFNRAFTITDAITTYLPGIYEPSSHEGRYDYVPGESSAGVVTYDDKFSFSHHATDPASGQLCSAFDLVRIHRFGDEDADVADTVPGGKRPSFKAMTDWARTLPEVKAQLARDLAQQADAEFDVIDDPDSTDWMNSLTYGRNGKLQDELANYVHILRYDPNLTGIAWNEHRDGIDIRTRVPWGQIKPGFTDTDYAQLRVYIQKTYGLYSPGKLKDAVTAIAATRVFNPVKEYLESLPEWDGVPRVDTLLVDYLGAQDSIYTRQVMRKALCAAVRRVYKPGVKYDYMVILNGRQGTGKSTFIARLGGDWFSDALTLSDMRDKAAAEKLQGYWIMEISEMAGMRKTDVETVKSFISRTDDKYRQAYATMVESHPRRCILMGTTNSELGFLRDATGNRRFLPVLCAGDGQYKPWDLTTEVVDQIWAEARVLEAQGEPLFLSGPLAAIAREQQEQAMETDEREGLIMEYLDTPLPANWDELNVYDRRAYLDKDPALTIADDSVTFERQTVSNIEIWAECFGKKPEEMRASDSYQLSAMLTKIPGWTRLSEGERKRIPNYGRQRLWGRLSERGEHA